MKNLIDNKFTNLYLNAAKKLNLRYKLINEKTAYVKIYNNHQYILVIGNVIGVNKELNARIAANKKKTSILLNEKSVPTPQFTSFKDYKEATRFANEKLKSKKLMVIKPLSGEGAHGVTVNPTTKKQIDNALKEAFATNTEIMIEEYIEGNHFRITIFDGEIIAVTQRTPAYVVGDEKKTVTKLIEQKNIKRAKENLPLIKLRKKDKDYLCTKNVHLTAVYNKGERVDLQLGCDLDIGGERTRIFIEEIPEENRKMFKKAARTIGLRLSGIDFISPDITTPYNKVKCAVNEINSCPSFEVHYLDSFPNNNYAAERLFEKYFQCDRKNEALKTLIVKRPKIKTTPSVLNISKTPSLNL